MGTPPLHSRYMEEALIAGLLFHGEQPERAFAEFSDEDIFYDDLRQVSCAARSVPVLDALHVMCALGECLEEVRWRGLVGEEMILDLCSRFVGDPSSYFPIATAAVVHNYGERRRALQRAQEEIERAYGGLATSATLSPPVFDGELDA